MMNAGRDVLVVISASRVMVYDAPGHERTPIAESITSPGLIDIARDFLVIPASSVPDIELHFARADRSPFPLPTIHAMSRDLWGTSLFSAAGSRAMN
jgi:hypothetical protein